MLIKQVLKDCKPETKNSNSNHLDKLTENNNNNARKRKAGM